jgi:hypothetical protein
MRTYPRWGIYVAWPPNMVAPRTLKSCELHLGHDSMRYITNRDIPQLFDDEELTPLPSRYIPIRYIEGDAMLTILDQRQQRGLEIAATSNIVRKGVLLREARKDPFVYLILAECRLIAFEGPGSAAILRGP